MFLMFAGVALTMCISEVEISVLSGIDCCWEDFFNETDFDHAFGCLFYVF